MLDLILQTVSDALVITDENFQIIRVNPAFERLTGLQAEDISGPAARQLILGNMGDQSYEELNKKLIKEGSWEGNILYRCSDGENRQFHIVIKAMIGDGEPLKYLVTFRNGDDLTGSDIRQAQHDTLTGLPNIHLFHDRISQAMVISKREDKSVALLMIGLDRFALINEGMGMESGDQVLKETANRLIKCIRQSDTAAKMRGDQFAVITPIASLDDSVIVAEKVLKAVHQPFEINGQSIVLSTSIGISLYPTDAQTPEALIEKSENAMRHIKRLGGNQYQFFANYMNVRAKKRLEIENALRRAIENEEFVVYYQPKVNMEDNSIVGAEALVRWIDPVKGLISPADFIPVAEETGMINPIGYWVLRDACAQNKLWQISGYKPLRMAVNVSAHQFMKPDLISRVTDILNETKLDPQYLELEITESMLMGDIEEVIDKMHSLRRLGIGLSIDDFGTGYSCLSYLTRFPITTLKIDRAFIKDLETDADMAEIARAIIALSQGLKLEIVAEGAETAGHIDFLKSNACDMVQGFFFSKPVTAAEFEKLLAVGHLNGTVAGL